MLYILGFAALLIVVWLLAMRLFPHTITLKEGLIMIVVQCAVIAFIIFGSLYGQGSDVQILNGEVTSKSREITSCEHSYSCNCRQSCSGSGKTRSCTTICDTCYEHSHDYNWVVKSNVGSVNIDRIDRRGSSEPPRWTIVQLGDPFSKEVNYYNYIKASPFSIFNKSTLDENVPVPGYIHVKDYYRVDRVVTFGVNYTTEMSRLNDLLNERLKKLGPTKKVNIVVIFHNQLSSFSETLKAKHLGGKINDVYVVVGIKEQQFASVDAFSWSKNSLVNVAVRDAVSDVNEINAEKLTSAIADNVEKYYNYRSIEEFKYLDAEVEVPTWAVWFAIIFGFAFPFGSAFIAHRYDIA